MLPFPIYNIPEAQDQRITSAEHWLCIVLGESLTAQNQDLLEKICLALKADWGTHVFILETDQEQMMSLPKNNEFKLIISFGILPSQLALWIDLQTAGIKFLETFTFILTSTLGELSQRPAAKKQLWNAMLSYLDLNPAK